MEKVTTFTTEVDFDVNATTTTAPTNDVTSSSQFESFRRVTSNDVRLPPSVNAIALRESLLSEAPFVTKTNKAFWRRMIDDARYQHVLSAVFRFVLAAISDIGSINLDKLAVTKDDPFVEMMSTNMSEMIFFMKLRDRDLFFAKLPEITSFMVIEALHTCMPKHYRVYNSVRFREILLDWTSEMIGGIRITNCRANREWLFSDAQQSQIMTSSTKTLTNTLPPLKQGSTSSLLYVEHSPLVRKYMGIEGTPHAGGICFKLALSHHSNRPLTTTLSEQALIRHGKTHPKHCTQSIKQTLRETGRRQKDIMENFRETEGVVKADIRKMNDVFRIHLDHLSNKKVSNKQLVAAMQASNN